MAQTPWKHLFSLTEVLRCTQMAGQMSGGFFHRSATSTSIYDATYMKFNAQEDSGSVEEKEIYKLDNILYGTKNKYF